MSSNNKTTSFDDILDDMRGKLCAEYEASADLKAEFLCGEDYAAYFLNTATATPLIRGWRADFDATAAERAAAIAEARRAASRVRISHN